MGIFDFFRRNKSKKHELSQDNKFEAQKDDNKIIANDKVVTSFNPYADQKYKIVIEGETLKKVRDCNIKYGEFIIPDCVKVIDMFAFHELKNLQTLVLHSGIRYIAPNAFDGCENLIEVKGLENANEMTIFNGFNNCTNLKEISMPDNVQRIGDFAFNNCKSLTSIKLPHNCWTISNQGFAGCENLQYIEIPTGVEILDSGAFAGCKNLVITFPEELEKRYLCDLEKELDEFNPDLDHSDLYESLSLLNSNENMSCEERKNLYDKLNVRYKEFEIGGTNFVLPQGKIIIKPHSLDDVKEVIVCSQEMLEKVINSGYKGKITLVEKQTQIATSIDFRLIEKMTKQKQQELRENYYRQCVIPSGGTTNWLINCERNNYRAKGYSEELVCEILISEHCRIEVKDYTQPKYSEYEEYNTEREEFFTNVVFYKKEMVANSITPHIYDRAYVVYYPYGVRFDEEMLSQIGKALNKLIDNARNLSQNELNRKQLEEIWKREKQLIDLLLKGTNDKSAVSKIMQGINLKSASRKVTEAKTKKDWLPYFTESLFNDFKELEEYRKANNGNE